MSIQRLSCFFNLWSSCSSRPKQRRSCRLLLPHVAGCAVAEASPPPTTPTAGQTILLLTHTPCYSAVMTASHRSEPVNPRTPLRTAVSSPALRRPLPRPRRRPPPWCSRRGVVNMVKERLPSDVDCTWRPHTRKCLLITRKIMIPPPNSWDRPEGPLYFAKKCSPQCQLGPTSYVFARKEVPPYYAKKNEYSPC